MGATARVAIGLGSNLGDPCAQLRSAVAGIGQVAGVRVAAVSSLYRSAPMGPQDQPDYVNAVALVDTELEPLALLDALQGIEDRHGRLRTRRWGERTLDLDVLLWSERVIDHPRLTVPHPGLPDRAFVLYPLRELDPTLRVPGRGTVAELCESCPAGDLSVIESPPR